MVQESPHAVRGYMNATEPRDASCFPTPALFLFSLAIELFFERCWFSQRGSLVKPTDRTSL